MKKRAIWSDGEFVERAAELEAEVDRLKQPGPCGKHPAACLETHTMERKGVVARTDEVCSACESERAAVEREREACAQSAEDFLKEGRIVRSYIASDIRSRN